MKYCNFIIFFSLQFLNTLYVISSGSKSFILTKLLYAYYLLNKYEASHLLDCIKLEAPAPKIESDRIDPSAGFKSGIFLFSLTRC